MKNFTKLLSATLIFISFCFQSKAANRFWVAAAPAGGNWSNPANWSNVSGGAGGFTAPVAGDVVTFDGGGLGDCNIDATVSVGTITVNATYSGTIGQGGNTITTSGAVIFGGGTFTGGSANITFAGAFTLSGTAIFTSTSAILEFQNNITFTAGTFNHNNGSVRFNRGANQTISGNAETFYNLELVGRGFTITISSGALTVTNTLTISGSSTLTINTGTINANGDINVTNTVTGGGGSGLININGTLNQNFIGGAAAGQGALPQLTINKTSGTLSLSNYPSIANAFTYTAGTISAGTSNFCFTRATTGAYTISGSVTLNSISFIANANLTATIALGTTITANGSMTISGTANVILNTGTINLLGDLILTNTGAGGGGSATINIAGTSNQNIDGSAITGNQSLLPIVTFNSSSTVALLGNISFAQNVTYTTGTINAGVSTCYITNSLTMTGSFSVYNLTINRGANATLTIAGGTTITATNNLDMENAAFNITINTGTLAVGGNIIDNNTGIAGGGSATILINGTGNQNISSSGVIYQGSFPGVNISKGSGTLTFPSLITVRGNWTYTSGTLDVSTNNSTVVFGLSLTITGTHTLNNVDFDAAGNYTFTTSAGTTLTINGNMSMTNTNNIILNTGNINLNGNLNLSNTGTAGGGTTVLSFTGSTNQSITGALLIDQSRLPAVTINKSGGTLTFNSLITVRGNWTYTAGSFDVTTNNSTIIFRNTLTITGSHTLNNVTMAANGNYTYTASTGTVLTVTGTLNTSGASNVTINTPVAGATAIQAQGDIIINNTGAAGGGTGLILINGTNSQALTSTAAASQGRLPYITISKTGGTLTLTGIISVTRDWTYNSGTVDATTNTSTVVFGGNNLNITSAGMNFYNFTVTANTSTITNSLSVNGNLTINGTGILSAGANSINLLGNWINRGTAGFTEATSTVNFNGSALQTITSPGGENFTNLTVNNTGTGIQLINNATVATTLNMTQGNIDLNANTLTLGISIANKGTLIRTIGTMINSGTFTRWFNTTTIPDGSINGLFPVGTATDYRPFYVSAPVSGPTTGGTISISYTDATTNTVVSFPDGVFTVVIRKDVNWAMSTANGLAGGNYNARVEGTGLGTIGNVSDLRLTLVNSVVGTAGTNAGTNSNPQINRTGLSLANLTNTFYPASINLNGTTLPVTLISFTAVAQNGVVKLDWETASETNNDDFTVQRSSNASAWSDVKELRGSGNTSSVSYYTAYDESPLPGVSYYRLKQTDVDGKSSYSVTKTIDMSNAVTLSVYPNPATTYITVGSASFEKLTIMLFNNNGQRVSVPISSNGNKAILYVSGVNTGTYFLQIIQGNSTEIRKITIVR
jgi:hypothetical protein